MRILSLFSGIGAFENALMNTNIKHEIINFSEIYKPAIRSYCELHNTTEDQNLGDITKVNPKVIDDFDLMSYGFPCQSFSIMGNKRGFCDPKNGGLFFSSMKIVKEKQPKYLIAENVPGLLSNDNGNTFKTILRTLNELGYRNKFKVLNSSNFDIPQDRNRVFIVSIRKDIEQKFNFSLNLKTTNKRVRDIIDFKIKDRIVNKDLIEYLDNEYTIRNKTNLLFDGCSEGIFEHGWTAHRLYTIHGISPTLTTGNGPPYFLEIRGGLVGKERLRLQGFTDSDYNKIKNLVSESELAYMAGNSITVNILEDIFRNLFDEEYINNRKDVLDYWI